jgi:hypothetical protein
MTSKSDKNTIPDDLPPRTRQMVAACGLATRDLDLDEDTEAWIDPMQEKYEQTRYEELRSLIF